MTGREVILAGKLKAEKLGRDWLIPQGEARQWLTGRKKGEIEPNQQDRSDFKEES